jgi:hypothetical protein
MKKVKRPDIDSATGQIDPRWSGGLNNHSVLLVLPILFL